MYSISYSRGALKALRRMPTNTAKLIRAKLRALAADPAAMRNVKKLTGSPGYRLRVGDWRVIYKIDPSDVVLVVKIGHRREIYDA